MDKNKVKKIAEQIEKANLAKIKDLEEVKINYEPFVYPVQYAKYKNEVRQTKSFVEKHNNLFSIGAGGDFNYADSQVLFHKSFDLVDMIVTNNKIYNVEKIIFLLSLTKRLKFLTKKLEISIRVLLLLKRGSIAMVVLKLPKI